MYIRVTIPIAVRTDHDVSVIAPPDAPLAEITAEAERAARHARDHHTGLRSLSDPIRVAPGRRWVDPEVQADVAEAVREGIRRAMVAA